MESAIHALSIFLFSTKKRPTKFWRDASHLSIRIRTTAFSFGTNHK